MSTPAFLWWELGGTGEGISGSRDAAWRIAARGLNPAAVAKLLVTVKEARADLTGSLDVSWEPTGRAWIGHANGSTGVAWESVIPE